MKFLRQVIQDVLFISKITGTKNKKILISTSVICSQLAAVTDVFLIGLFAYLIADQKTNIEFIDSIALFFSNNKGLLLIIVFFRFFFLFFQSYILRRIEFTVTKNLKEYILKQIFERRSYSTSDAYFYTNDLSAHIGYFYSNFASFLNSILNVIFYCAYLLASNFQILAIFGLGLLTLFYPIKSLLKISRNYVDKAYFTQKDSFGEIERVIENLFLIKILKKESHELSNFSKTLQNLNILQLNKHIFSVINGYLPSFLTLVILSIILIFFAGVKLTLDFIGVTLKLFGSLSAVTGSFSNILNSHVHISKFKELKFDQNNPYSKNFIINKNSHVELEKVNFCYQNSTENIFNDLDLIFQKGSHTILTGENGTGKSTLLGLIAGIYYPQNGTVTSYSNKFGYVSAQPYVFRDTLLNNILYGQETSNISEAEVLEKLKEFKTFKNTEDYDLSRLVSNKTLSSGQMQKIGFIRILLSNPDIILLDESTSNLDTNSKKIVFENLKLNNSTVINSTHDPDNFDFVDHHVEIKIINEKRSIVNMF